MTTNSLNGRELTEQTPGRTRVIFNSVDDDGSFSYLLRAESETTVYTIRAFMAYENENGGLTYVYADPVTCSVSSAD